MNEEVCEIPARLWEEYGELQHKADRSKLDHYTWALEDQLNYFVDSIAGRLPQNPEARSKSLRNLVLNRTKKHSRRTRLVEKWYPLPLMEPSPEDVVITRSEQKQTIAVIRAATSDAEWKMLISIAGGRDYRTVAKQVGISISALKARVSRCRSRLSAVAA